MSFGSNRPTFKPTPYGYTRRSRRGIPRWLLLLITGIVLGAGGVLFLQRSYGPQRLTVEQSEQLRMDLNTANLENQRINTESKTLRQNLEQTQAAQKQQDSQIELLRKHAADMEAGVAGLIAAIPPDPRGTSPGIRSADMVLGSEGLSYQVLLIQDLKEGNTQVPNMRGEVKLIGSGTYPNGNTAYVDLGSQPLNMGRYTVISGQTELPKAYRLHQVTVQIMGEDSDKVIATRTFRVTAAKK
ncbi:MAG: hypothetical protein WBF69_10400 [Castellaniella sp.]|uniref:hypothetical protein n=1 Tax=Castellaniella sp. TaxID=1955812 RepID=UPI003C74E498